VCATLYRDGLPDDLPQEPAQRSLRRGADGRRLRGLSGKGLHLGEGLYKVPDSALERGVPRDQKAGRLEPGGVFVMAELPHRAG